MAAALVVGLILFFQYDSYIESNYTEAMESTAKSVVRLFPGLKDIDGLISEGRAGSQSYFNLVRQIGEIRESFGYVYIYYLQLERGRLRFIFDTDDIPMF